MDPRYRPLNQHEDEIRLLEVDLSDSRNHSLIQNVSLRDSRRSYLALSYPWGPDPTEGSVTIRSRQCQVSKNLENAISSAISYWRASHRKNDVLYLWCDQICINQQDTVEKGHQVSYMKTIYQKAALVLIWLPTRIKVTEDYRLYALSSRLGDDVNSMLSGNIFRRKPSDAGPVYFKTWSEWKDWHLMYLRRTEEWFLENHPHGSKKSKPERWADITQPDLASNVHIVVWSHIVSLVGSQWWVRVWVYQEFMLSSEAVFLIDDIGVSRAELSDFLEEVDHILASLPAMIRGYEEACVAAQKLDKRKRLTELQDDAGHSNSSFVQDLLRSLLTTQSPGYLIRKMKHRMLRQLADHWWWTYDSVQEAWPRVMFMLNSKSDFQANVADLRLSELAKHIRNCRCSDQRDKIYALAGLVDPAYNITPDYSPDLHLDELIMSTTRSIIAVEQSLNFLSGPRESLRLRQTRNVLPSWVMNFTTPDEADTDYVRLMDEIEFPSACRASECEKPVVEFRRDRTGRPGRRLVVQGIKVCTLESILNETRCSRTFGSQSKYAIVTTKTSHRGDEIWILKGADVPFALASTKDGNYELCGPAMIRSGGRPSGIMYGYMIGQERAGKVKSEMISIV